jgi:hypothetical protein
MKPEALAFGTGVCGWDASRQFLALYLFANASAAVAVPVRLPCAAAVTPSTGRATAAVMATLGLQVNGTQL